MCVHVFSTRVGSRVAHPPRALQGIVIFSSSAPGATGGVIHGMMARQVNARKRLLTWHMRVFPWRFCKFGRHAYTNSVISRKAQLVNSRTVFTLKLHRMRNREMFSRVLHMR